MTSRIVLIGCGGIGSQLAGPLVRYLANRPEPPLLVLVDGDAFEAGNLHRQACAVGDLGTNKAEALARVARSAGLAVQVVPEYVTEANVGQLVREGDLVLLAVDGHRFEASLRLVLERPRRLVEPPTGWLERVKLLPPPRPKKRTNGSTEGTSGSLPALGSSRTRPSRSEFDSLVEKAGRMADELGYRLSYWLVPVSPPREPGVLGND